MHCFMTVATDETTWEEFELQPWEEAHLCQNDPQEPLEAAQGSKLCPSDPAQLVMSE
jgi:hypothetical protein